MNIEFSQIVTVGSIFFGLMATLIGIIWNSLNKRIDKSEEVCIQNSADVKLIKEKADKIPKIEEEIKDILTDVSTLKSKRDSDHQWIMNINSAIGDIRKSK